MVKMMTMEDKEHRQVRRIYDLEDAVRELQAKFDALEEKISTTCGKCECVTCLLHEDYEEKEDE